MSHLEQTEIGMMQNGEYHLWGQSMTSLIGRADWVATMWLTWTGREISAAEHEVLSGCLVA